MRCCCCSVRRFFLCVAHLRFQISRCLGQRLAFLPRRPAILVLSVLLTATLMCVTLFFSLPSSAVLHLLCSSLHSCSSAFSSADDDGDEGLGGEVDSRDPSVVCSVCFFSPKHLGLNGLKIAPVAVGEQCSQVAPLRGDAEPYESSVRTCGTQKSTPSLQSDWLYFFFFKTENNRFTTGLF